MVAEDSQSNAEREAPEPTASLLERIRSGEGRAREQLFARYLPILRRWAHGRLPGYARDLSDTDDLVQVTLLRALNNLDEFQAERSEIGRASCRERAERQAGD